MPSAGFEAAIATIERLQTHTLDRMATVIGKVHAVAAYLSTAHVLSQTLHVNIPNTATVTSCITGLTPLTSEITKEKFE